jgi:hypothetical protein
MDVDFWVQIRKQGRTKETIGLVLYSIPTFAPLGAVSLAFVLPYQQHQRQFIVTKSGVLQGL